MLVTGSYTRGGGPTKLSQAHEAKVDEACHLHKPVVSALVACNILDIRGAMTYGLQSLPVLLHLKVVQRGGGAIWQLFRM